VTSAALHWQPSPLARQLVVLTTFGLAVALATRRAELLPLAAPALVALCVGGRGAPPRAVEVRASAAPPRCFEGEAVQLGVTVRASGMVEELVASLALTAGLQASPDDLRVGADNAAEVALEVAVTPARWGRWSPGAVTVRARSAQRLRAASVTLPLDLDVVVFPRPAVARPVTPPRSLPYGIGDHASRQPASGIEFAGIRRYVAGDAARRINWPVSTRRGALHVTTFAAERPVDVVVMIDAFSDVGPAGRSSLDLAVRGATGLASAALRQRDRVGLVILGGRLQWLTPSLGERQFYRVIEAVMAVRRDRSYLQPDLAHVPRAALPPAAAVVVFSPLLDDRALEVVRDLRERGAQVSVVDVLTVEPPDVGRGRRAQLALRLWRLEREAMRFILADIGIAVRAWDGEGPV
jgi:uncharacterized protein (DUF58 family)